MTASLRLLVSKTWISLFLCTLQTLSRANTANHANITFLPLAPNLRTSVAPSFNLIAVASSLTYRVCSFKITLNMISLPLRQKRNYQLVIIFSCPYNFAHCPLSALCWPKHPVTGRTLCLGKRLDQAFDLINYQVKTSRKFALGKQTVIRMSKLFKSG